MSGDPFLPLDCSTKTVVAPAIGISSATPSTDVTLKDVSGKWEGALINGFNRYALLVEIDGPNRKGTLTATLKFKEMQFLMRGVDTLTMTSSGPGRWNATWSIVQMPESPLKGEAVLGVAAAGVKNADRQIDFAFENGALYRIRFKREKRDALTATIWSAVPGMEPRQWDVRLARSSKNAP
jgi:hypothetical protein